MNAGSLNGLQEVNSTSHENVEFRLYQTFSDLHLCTFELPPSFLILFTVFAASQIKAETDLETLRGQAEGGDVKAQRTLAFRYRDGNGVAKDEIQALRWAHRAADGGDADAMDFVGFAFLRGSVIERNPAIAFGYFRAAAKRSAQAAFNLGQCYFGAQGTEQDFPKAMEYWEKAAAGGHGRAAACAAMAYLSGEGIAPDPKKGARFCRARGGVERSIGACTPG